MGTLSRRTVLSPSFGTRAESCVKASEMIVATSDSETGSDAAGRRKRAGAGKRVKESVASLGHSIGSDVATAMLVSQEALNQPLVQWRALSSSRDPCQNPTVGQILVVVGTSNLITDEVGSLGARCAPARQSPGPRSTSRLDVCCRTAAKGTCGK